MGKRDSRVQVVQVTPREALSLALAERASIAAAEALHAGGYPKPTDAQFKAISSGVSQAALLMPHLVEDMAATTDQQLEEAADAMGAAMVAAVLGPPPGAC